LIPQVEVPTAPLVRVTAVAGTLPGSHCQAVEDASWPIPLERWDVDWFSAISQNKMDSRFGSFISGAEMFDNNMFRLSRYGCGCKYAAPDIRELPNATC
jgi:hypothetical protein